ncbi:MAG: hypothetical protein Q8Q31_01875 [Nanoarchaeota archaeon]|nr:hypothetical protein [Nanoarchaeota archaeon]
MRKLSQQNKKGLSEMVSYILLIVGALGLSVLVFNYLKDFTPKGQTECDDEVSLSIREYSCDVTQKKLTLELYNNGKFNIPDFYVKIGLNASKIRYPLNDISGGIAFKPGQRYTFTANSQDLELLKNKYGLDLFSPGKDYVVEIQPVIADRKSKNWAVCENAVISQQIDCGSGGGGGAGGIAPGP